MPVDGLQVRGAKTFGHDSLGGEPDRLVMRDSDEKRVRDTKRVAQIGRHPLGHHLAVDATGDLPGVVAAPRASTNPVRQLDLGDDPGARRRPARPGLDHSLNGLQPPQRWVDRVRFRSHVPEH